MKCSNTVLAVSVAVMVGTPTIGCGVSTRSVFHPTDRSFRPAPGSKPAVYLSIDDVPKLGMRSVGLIEVTVPESSGIKGAIDVASKKGSELGCWILIEESIFATVQMRASLDHGVTLQLAHGGGGTDPGGQGHGASGASGGKLTAEFHCVVQATSGSARAGRLDVPQPNSDAALSPASPEPSGSIQAAEDNVKPQARVRATASIAFSPAPNRAIASRLRSSSP